MTDITAEYLSHFGSDLSVSNAARVSMNKWHDEFEEGDARLIEYLARENHWTPFAHAQIQFRISAPIFVARQWTRHTVGVVRSEVSRRYVDTPPEFFFPDKWRMRPDKNIKQGSGQDFPIEDQQFFDRSYKSVIDHIAQVYEGYISSGMAPEQARMILPQSMITQWVETGSLIYWARFYKLRIDAHAQKEIQDAARQISEAIKPLFPVSWHALTGAQND